MAGSVGTTKNTKEFLILDVRHGYVTA